MGKTGEELFKAKCFECHKDDSRFTHYKIQKMVDRGRVQPDEEEINKIAENNKGR
ncbi:MULTISPECIES: hypothetical protein [unclassified Archaeoglobus]|uniref:hypothetical protein n=1 Tax=unclassified Archaeoglobus TaxID=2643606 RepID=UPI0025C3D8E7|nr:MULTISPECIES: hypothetical protein [unclassified Archaeoglobus]